MRVHASLKSARQPFPRQPPSAPGSSQELARSRAHAPSSLPRDISASTLVRIPCLCLTLLHISPAPCQLLLAKRSKLWQRGEASPPSASAGFAPRRACSERQLNFSALQLHRALPR